MMQDNGSGKDLEVAVLGATGQLGAPVVQHLRNRGAVVLEVSRRQGVDAWSGHGPGAALAGVSTVEDCLNLATLSRKRAVDFFTTTARHVLTAAEQAGVSRIVSVSVVNARLPAAHRRLGYNAGKAAQEQGDRAGPVPVAVVASTQRFELAEPFLSQTRIGPFSIVLGLCSRPPAVDEAAAFVADRALEHENIGTYGSDVVIAGPEARDTADPARAVNERRGGRRRAVRVPVSFTALGQGGLLPQGDFTIASTRFEDRLGTTS